MTNPITPPPITPLPPGPRPTDTPDEFNSKSFATIEAQEAMVLQLNSANAATHQNAVSAQESAVGATGSASAAASSASAAAASASSAAVVDRWDKLVLGSHADFPTTDNDGAPLQVGAEFYHSTDPKGRYSWTGTAWAIGTNVTAGVASVNGQSGTVVLDFVGAPAAALDKTALMANAPLNKLACYGSSTGSGSDWPLTALAAAWWNVFTFGTTSRATQMAMQVLAGASAAQSVIYTRSKVDSAWSAWRMAGEQAIGSVYTGAAKPADGSWLEMDTVYLQSAYPALYSAIGKVHNGDFAFASSTFPFADTTYSATPFELNSSRIWSWGQKSGATWLASYSDNGGASWSASTGFSPPQGAAPPGSVAYIGNNAVAIVSSVAYQSANNGAAWAGVSVPGSGDVYAIGGQFLRSNGATAVSASATGAGGSWSTQTTTIDGSAAAVSLDTAAYSAAKALWFALNSTGSAIISSSDGIAWSTVKSNPAAESLNQGSSLVVFGDYVGVVFFSMGYPGQVSMTFSRDLSNWRTSAAGITGVGAISKIIAIDNSAVVFPVWSAGDGSQRVSVVVFDGGGGARASKFKVTAAPASISRVAGRIRLAGVGAAYMSAPLYPYTDSTQFLTPAMGAQIGAKQWIKAA